MKFFLRFLFSLIIFVCCRAGAQTKPLLISPNGIDAIRIGMSIPQVEQVLHAKLQPFVITDTTEGAGDSSLANSACQDCTERFICKYKGVEFLLTFFRHTLYEKTDFELVGITPTSMLPVVQTKAGIKVGMTESKFVSICEKNKYSYNIMETDPDNKGCFFTDNPDDKSSKLLMITLSKGKITSLAVINMVGD